MACNIHFYTTMYVYLWYVEFIQWSSHVPQLEVALQCIFVDTTSFNIHMQTVSYPKK